MKHATLSGLFLAGFAALSFAQAPAKSILIGTLEDDRAETVNWKKGPAKNRVVRPLFEKMGGEWVLSESHDRRIDWLITFDGRSLGAIKSRPSKIESGFNAFTHLPLAQPGQALTVGKPSNLFSGWQNTLFNRPLVLVSGGKVEDPDQWTRFQPTPDELRVFRSVFRKEYPEVVNCDKNEEPLPAGKWQYTDDQIRVWGGYRSRNGEAFVNLRLLGGQCGVLDGPFVNQTILLRTQGAAWLSAKGKNDNELSLSLVDAGDYDGDGKSELLFFLSGYNEDGYALFYDSFRKGVQSTWSYH